MYVGPSTNYSFILAPKIIILLYWKNMQYNPEHILYKIVTDNWRWQKHYEKPESQIVCTFAFLRTNFIDC